MIGDFFSLYDIHYSYRPFTVIIVEPYDLPELSLLFLALRDVMLDVLHKS